MPLLVTLIIGALTLLCAPLAAQTAFDRSARGTAAQRPAAANPGRLYQITDAASSSDCGPTLTGGGTAEAWSATNAAGTAWECLSDQVPGSGSGDVVGPASSTDNAIARFDGTGGKTLQNSGVTVDDSGNVTTAGAFISTGPSGFDLSGNATPGAPATDVNRFAITAENAQLGQYNDAGTLLGLYNRQDVAIDGDTQTLQHRRAADCTAETGGVISELCVDSDDGSVYVCIPSAGGCDTSGEWIALGGGGTSTWSETFGLVTSNALNSNERMGFCAVAPNGGVYQTYTLGSNFTAAADIGIHLSETTTNEIWCFGMTPTGHSDITKVTLLVGGNGGASVSVGGDGSTPTTFRLTASLRCPATDGLTNWTGVAATWSDAVSHQLATVVSASKVEKVEFTVSGETCGANAPFTLRVGRDGAHVDDNRNTTDSNCSGTSCEAKFVRVQISGVN